MDRPQAGLCRTLRNHGFKVLESYSADHAVALCAAEPIKAVLLHQGLFVEVAGWSVAQSIKLVKKDICVVLVLNAEFVNKKRLPKGVDAVVPDGQPKQVAAVLDQVLGSLAK